MRLADELLMRAAGDDPPPLHDGNAVSAPEGGGAVGDDEHRAPAHEDAQGLLDLVLGLRVRHGGGLVEQEDRRVLEEGAGDGQALLLPAGQARLLAEDRVIAVGQRLDDRIDAGGGRGGADLLVGGIGPGEGDVVADGRPQELGVLEDEGHGAEELALAHVAQVGAADAHGPGVRVGEARDEGGQGGFARARGAEQSGHGSRLEGEGGVVDGEGLPVGVGDMIDLHPGAVVAPHAPSRAAAAGGEHGGVEHVDEAQGGGAGDLVGPGDRHDGDHRGREHEGDEHAGEGLRGSDLPGVDEHPAAPEVDHEEHGDGDPDVGGAGRRRHRQRPVAVEGGEAVGGGDVGAVGAAHPPEGLDHADAGDELDHGRRDLGQAPVHLHGLLLHAAHGQGVGAHIERDGGHREQPEAPVDGEGVDEEAHGGDECVDVVDGAVRDDGVDRAGVVLDGFAQRAGARRREPGQRRGRQPAHDGAAQVVAQGEVRGVGDEQGDEVQTQAPRVGADEQADGGPCGVGVDGGAGRAGVQEEVAQPHEGHVGGDGEQTGGDGEDLAGQDTPAHGGGEPFDRGLALAGAALVVRRLARGPGGARGWGITSLARLGGRRGLSGGLRHRVRQGGG